jgi:hypothetical protein
MFDGQVVSHTASNLTQILGWAREVSIIGVLLGAAWKARGIWDAASLFLDRIEKHMTHMETFADTVVDNHLKHIERSLDKLTRSDDARETVRLSDELDVDSDKA